MKKKIYHSLYLFILIAAAIIGYTIPIIGAVLIFWVLCGIIDVSRSRNISTQFIKKYFFGQGKFTFLLSPINLFFDLISKKNHKIYHIDTYPKDYQEEITHVIQLMEDNKDKIKNYLKNDMEKYDRTMCFFQWYGKNYTTLIPEFNQKYKYIITIGVSSFRPKHQTIWHFGPIRSCFRILYSLFPSPDAFLETQGKKFYWNDNPFFSFDDTLLHRSVNNGNDVRYCAFIDVQRPAYPITEKIIQAFNRVIRSAFDSAKTIFYKKWKMIR